jgi:hypothetical protein
MLPTYLNSWIFLYHRILERSRWLGGGTAVKLPVMEVVGGELEICMKRDGLPTEEQ